MRTDEKEKKSMVSQRFMNQKKKRGKSDENINKYVYNLSVEMENRSKRYAEAAICETKKTPFNRRNP